MGLGVDQIRSAMEFAGGLQLAAPFSAATHGSAVRNHWVGHANAMAVLSARLAATTAAPCDLDLPGEAIRLALGDLDESEVVGDLGAHFEIERDYVKRHAACAYTHAPLDAVLQLLSAYPTLDLADIETIRVLTNTGASELAPYRRSSRLSAMFSMPHVIAACLMLRSTGPELTSPEARSDERISELARKVDVTVDPALDAALPSARGAVVTVVTTSGDVLEGRVENAVGDSPSDRLSWAEARAKARRFMENDLAEQIESSVRALPSAPEAADIIDRMLVGAA